MEDYNEFFSDDEEDERITRSQYEEHRKQQRSILDNLDLPTDIKKIAIARKTERESTLYPVRNDRISIFVFLYNLLINEKILYNPEKLVEKLELSNKEVAKATKIISGTSLNKMCIDGNSIVIHSPIIFIDDYSKIISSEEDKEKIVKLVRFFKDNYRKLNSITPQKIMAYTVKYYYTHVVPKDLPKIEKNGRMIPLIDKKSEDEITNILKNYKTGNGKL